MNKISVIIILLMVFSLVSLNVNASGKEEAKKTALLIIDVQNFYFPKGASALVNPEAASLNCKKVLKKFRDEHKLVIHVWHQAKSGAEIHESVTPIKGEKVIGKVEVNCFKDTDLLTYLKDHQITRLVICGMMTHMCVEAATRAGHDYGFECIVVHDACATRALKFKDKTVSAEDVHYSTLSALSFYAKVIDAQTFLKEK